MLVEYFSYLQTVKTVLFRTKTFRSFIELFSEYSAFQPVKKFFLEVEVFEALLQ